MSLKVLKDINSALHPQVTGSNPSQYNHNYDEVVEHQKDVKLIRTMGGRAFLAKVDHIKVLLKKLKDDIEAVKRTQNDILLCPNMETKRKELAKLQRSVVSTSRVILSNLTDEQREIYLVEGHGRLCGFKKEGVQIRIDRIAKLVRQLMELMKGYQFDQTEYQQRPKARLERQLEIGERKLFNFFEFVAGTPLTDEEIEKLMEDGNWAPFTQGIISESQQAKEMLASFDERHYAEKDSLQLKKSILKLHEMIKEMTMVVEHQLSLDEVQLVEKSNEKQRTDALVKKGQANDQQVVQNSALSRMVAEVNLKWNECGY